MLRINTIRDRFYQCCGAASFLCGSDIFAICKFPSGITAISYAIASTKHPLNLARLSLKEDNLTMLTTY
jgi:hypothetical protein